MKTQSPHGAKIPLESVTIFRFMPKHAAPEMSQLFVTRSHAATEALVHFGKPVDGLSVVVDGTVDVFSGGGEYLATLGAGASIGEMSLLEPSELASATIRAGATGTIVAYCPTDAFSKWLAGRDEWGKAFYQGAAALLSQRLRTTNSVLEERIRGLRLQVLDVINNYKLLDRLRGVQSSIENVGSGMISNLGQCLEALDKAIAAHPELQSQGIPSVKKVVERVVLEDLQTIDRIAQQLGLLHQFLENVLRVAASERVRAVSGDLNLFT